MEQQKKELTITRIVNAPREVVFKAWTDASQLAQWWGPAGFTNPVCEIDARPGGAILIHMQGPDGTIYPMTGTFVEVVEPERIVFKSSAMDKDYHPLFEVLNTISFSQEGDKTRINLQFTVSKITPEAAPYLAGMDEGWKLSLDRFDTFAAEPIIIERTFNAPITRLWEAISDRDVMKQWYFDLAEFKTEPGFEFSFEGGKDNNIYVHLCKVTEVIPGRKLTYSWRYKGYTGNSFVTFELNDEGEKTRLTLTHVGLGTFPANNPDFAKHNFVEGWTYIIGKSLREFIEKA